MCQCDILLLLIIFYWGKNSEFRYSFPERKLLICISIQGEASVTPSQLANKNMQTVQVHKLHVIIIIMRTLVSTHYGSKESSFDTMQ